VPYSGGRASSRGNYTTILPLEATLKIACAEIVPAKVALRAFFEAFLVSFLVPLLEAVPTEHGAPPKKPPMTGG
jgi:hypothetical protein